MEKKSRVNYNRT